MITGSRVLLLISILVFLVHNHQSQVPEREENGRTDSQNNIIAIFSQLFPPYLHPFGVGKLRVINAQPRAENPLQTFCNLGSQGNLRQQIQYLLSLTNSFFYQMNIYFRLTTGRHPMKQADILFPEGLYDFIVCPLLKLIQRIQFDDLLHLLVQPADLMMINLKYLFLYQTVQNGRRHIGALQQFFLGDFFRDFISQNPRTFHIFHQQCQLLRGTRQDIKQYMQPFFIRRTRKPHPRLRLGFVSTPQLLLYKNRFFIEQRLDDSQNIFYPALLLQLSDTLLCIHGKQIQNALFTFRQWCIRFKIGIILYNRFAFEFQSRRQRRLINIPLRTEIIIGYPLPKLELNRQ